ncbi:Bax inhibitor-1/YccA family protein [Microbacteriaceae bacterium 4G12]
MANPTFSRNPAFNGRGGAPTQEVTPESLQAMYNAPSATAVDTGRMTYEDTITKTAGLFAVLLVGAAVGWLFPALAIVGAIVGLVLGLVNSFKREPSVPLIVAYAAFEGLFVGGISAIFERLYPGVAVQAVLATLVVVGVVLALFRSGKIRASAKATKIFMIAMVSYLAFSLVNFGLVAFGVLDSPFGLRDGVIGLVIGALAVLMASYSLVLDFDFIQRAVRTGQPRKMGWQAAFGLMVTVVWLYVEFLRIFAILRGSD